MSGVWSGLIADDDVVAMEKSCFYTFVSPEQKNILLELWANGEAADNLAFLQEFAPDMIGIEEQPPLE